MYYKIWGLFETGITNNKLLIPDWHLKENVQQKTFGEFSGKSFPEYLVGQKACRKLPNCRWNKDTM